MRIVSIDDRRHVVRVVVDHALLAEAEAPVRPAEGGVDDPSDLKPEGLAQLLGLDQAFAHEQEAHALLASPSGRRERDRAAPASRSPRGSGGCRAGCRAGAPSTRRRRPDPPRNEIVIVSSSPSTFRTPVFRCRPSIWKMSVSEKTLSVPSRPTSDPPSRPTARAARPGPPAPPPATTVSAPSAPAAAASADRRAGSSTIAGREPEEEEEQRQPRRAIGRSDGECVGPGQQQRGDPARAVLPARAPLHRLGLRDLDLDVHAPPSR